MQTLRTADERFIGLPGYTFEPHYADLGRLRMHYLDEGAKTAPVALCLHGQPTWAYLYRKMIPALLAEGYRHRSRYGIKELVPRVRVRLDPVSARVVGGQRSNREEWLLFGREFDLEPGNLARARHLMSM